MKKTLLSFLLLFNIVFCYAQNYQCLQAGVKHYFINGNGYLRGIRIDSVRTSGSDVVYYPFHTPRGGYDGTGGLLDSNSGSWLGKKVVERSNGIFIFDDIWNDSLIIKTQANVGDSWILYSDSSSLFYQAQLVSEDTMTVLGGIDSIKKIIITARNGSGIVTSDPIDSFQIIISKNNGFVEVCDLFTFPYHKPDSLYRPGLDFYLDKSSTESYEAYGFTGHAPSAAISIFNLVSFTNPNYQQLYDFNPGDVYEYHECILPDGFACDFSYMGEPIVNSFFEFDSITGKILSGSNTKYHFIGAASYPNPFNIYYSPDAGVESITLDSQLLIDTLQMPEEYKLSPLVYYYLPNDNSYCLTSPYYDIVPSYLSGINAPFYFEGPVSEKAYKLGLGQLKNYNKSTSVGLFQIESSELGYYKNSITSCGDFHSLGIKDIQQNTANVFPNPANNSITIWTASSSQHTITMLNMMGQVIKSIQTNKQQETINVSTLPAGVYTVSITDESGNKINEKVAIIH